MPATPLGPVTTAGLGLGEMGRARVGTHSPDAVHMMQFGGALAMDPQQQQQAGDAANDVGQLSDGNADPWSSDSDIDSELGEPCELRADFLQTFEPVGAFLTKLGASFGQTNGSAAPAKQAPGHPHAAQAGSGDDSGGGSRLSSGELSRMAQEIQLHEEQPGGAASGVRDNADRVAHVEMLDSILRRVPTHGVTSLGELAALGMAFNAASVPAAPTAPPLTPASAQPAQPKPSMLDALWASAQSSQPDSTPPTHRAMSSQGRPTHTSANGLDPSVDSPTDTAMVSDTAAREDDSMQGLPMDKTQHKPSPQPNGLSRDIPAAGGDSRPFVQPNPLTLGALAAENAVDDLASSESEEGVPEVEGDIEGESVWDVEYGDLSAEDDADAMRKLGTAAGRIAKAMMRADRAQCKVCLHPHLSVSMNPLPCRQNNARGKHQAISAETRGPLAILAWRMLCSGGPCCMTMKIG